MQGPPIWVGAPDVCLQFVPVKEKDLTVSVSFDFFINALWSFLLTCQRSYEACTYSLYDYISADGCSHITIEQLPDPH